MKFSTFFALLLTLGTHSNAQIFILSFESQVTSLGPTAPAGVVINSMITGSVQIDLGSLPQDSHPFSTLGSYQYTNGMPGMQISFDTGSEIFTYDSLNAATGSGISRGIFVTDIVISNGVQAEDMVSYQMQETGDSSAAALLFSDEISPFNMLMSDQFPLSWQSNEVTRSEFIWFSDAIQSTTGFIAQVSSYEIQIIPEPSTISLLAISIFIIVIGVTSNNLTSSSASISGDVGRAAAAEALTSQARRSSLH